MTRKIFTLLFFFFTIASLSGQKIDPEVLKGLKIRNIGPAGMSGRVTSIDVVRNQADIIYAATASGGLWKSESGGVDWFPIFDEQAVQSVGAVAVNQQNPSIVWAGTGEGNPRNSQNSGNGIYKSLDAGRNWQLMGLENTKTIHRVILHPTDPDIVFVAAMGSAWGPNPERGVFRTTNGGASWEKVLFVNDSTGCADLVIDPSNPNKLIAAMWEYGRKPWFFKSGGKGSGIYVTFDGGKSWKQRTDKAGLPKGELGRVGLAIAPSNPEVVYALVEAKKTGLYRSDDGGFNWKMTADKNIGNRPFYYADIFVDPKNENRLYNLHSVVTRSEDGGKTFEVIVPYNQVHPDHHAFYIHPDDPSFLIDGNDGGMAISHNAGESWRFIENLPLAQFYHINYDMDVPYNVYGGMQDNGSWVGPSQVWQVGGIRNFHWQELYFGDGFDVVPDRENSRFGYAMSQGGYLARYDRETGHTEFIQPVHPEGETLRFNWNAAIAHDPFDNCTLYFGSQFVHKSTDCGQSWTIISPDLTTNDSTKQKQAKSGGLTIDATQAENFTTLLCIAPSPVTQGLIWAASDDGRLHLTTDGGQNWKDLSGRLKGAPEGAWIPQIEVSTKNAGTAFVVLNDYRRNNWQPYVYRTTDLGKTWTRIVNGNQVSGHAMCIVQDTEVPELLFLGTDHGLHLSLDGGKNWTRWSEGFPAVTVSDLKIHPREHDLIIGTFGRAAWILDDISPLRALSREGTGMLDKPFHLISATDGILAKMKPFTASHFPANAEFEGENHPPLPMISYWHKAEVKEEKEEKAEKDKVETPKNDRSKKDDDKVRVYILSETGDSIRTISSPVDTGFNRIYWDLSRDGERFPSYREPRNEDWTPSGGPVLPGNYVAHLYYKKDSAMVPVRVLPDPRIAVTMEELKAQEAAFMELISITQAATEAFNRLKEAKETVESLSDQMDLADEAVRDSLRKSGSAISDSIRSLMEIFLQPESFDGIDGVTEKLVNRLGRSRGYLNSASGKPGPTAILYLKQTREAVEETIRKVNQFFGTDWKTFREAVEKAEIPKFREYEPIELKD